MEFNVIYFREFLVNKQGEAETIQQQLNSNQFEQIRSEFEAEDINS